MIRKFFKRLVLAATLACAPFSAFGQTLPDGSLAVGGGPGFVGFKFVGPCVNATQVIAWAAGLPVCTNVSSLFDVQGTAPIDVNLVGTTYTISLQTPLAAQFGGTGADLSAATTGSLPYFSALGVQSAASPITGLVRGTGAGAPAAYAGATCVDAIYQLDASGAATCTTISAGSNITITPSGTNPRDLSIASTASGESAKPMFMAGLQAHRPVDQTRIAVNPGSWYSTVQGNYNKFDTVAEVELENATVDWSATPALGGMISTPMQAGTNNTDGTEVFLYLITRDSDEKPALIASSSDTFGSTRNFSAAIGSPGVINFSTAHGLRKRMSFRVRSTGGTLPSPLGAGITYYVCNVVSVGEITVATSIANANSNSCLNFTTAAVAPVVADQGVVFEYSWCCSATPATVSRGYPWFAFVWDVATWGSSGIPNFTTELEGPHTILTSADETSAYRILNAGSSTSWATINLSPWLANINRQLTVITVCRSPVTLGSCWIRPTGGGSNGLPVGNTPAVNINVFNYVTLQTNSLNQIDYIVSGGAQLTMYIQGWQASDPR